jgi:hypothetical protein
MKKLKSIQGIPLEYIRSVVKIDSNSLSGLTWLSRENKKFKFDNNHAGCKKTKEYGYQRWVISLNYNKKKYALQSSRIVFLLHHGYLTKGKCIDHIDNNSLNNKIENLRECTITQNNHNTKLRKNNTSGHKGVTWCKKAKKWKVAINANGKYHYFGLYVNLEDAIKVAIEARKKLHGKFGRDE